MKNLNLCVSVVISLLFMTSCVGIRTGVDFGSEKDKYDTGEFRASNNLEKATTTSTSSETGFYVGVFLTDIPITDDVELEPGINYVSIKDLDLLHAPILIKYNIDDKFSASAGPSLSYFLDQPTGLKSVGVGINAGVSYGIMDNFLLEAKYDLGISNLVENAPSGSSLKLSQFQVGIAYRFEK